MSSASGERSTHSAGDESPGALALLGTDPRVLAIGLQAVRRNVPLTGIWAPNHDEALLASLPLGCCAFASPEEPLRSAEWILYSALPELPLPERARSLAVEGLTVSGVRLVSSHQLGMEWQNWLRALGFEIVCSG